MLSQLARRRGDLIRSSLFPTYRPNAVHSSFPARGIFARYQSTANEFDDDESQLRRSFTKRRYTDRHPLKPRPEDGNQKVRLDVSTLGEPGEIVVVQERMRRRRSRRTSWGRETDPTKLPHFLYKLEPDSTQTDGSRVNEHIDSLREPHQPRAQLATEDFQSLRDKLVKSFTNLQLSGYIKTNSKGAENSAEKVLTDHGVLTFANWKPGTSAFVALGPVSKETLADRVAKSHNITAKALLAERVLRDCWQVGIANEAGELDIFLPTHTLSLLVGSDIFSFEELATRNEVSISVTNSLGHIRITGNERSCESVREIIHDYTHRIRAEEIGFVAPINVKPKDLAQTFSPEFFSWVEQTWKVSVERNSAQLPTRIYVLAENQHNVEAARRILNLALKKATSPGVPFSTYMPGSELANIKDVKLAKTADWHDRTKSWFRWQMPPISNKLLSLPGFIENENQLTISAELLKVLRQASPTLRVSRSHPEVRESITASFGRCHFLQSPFLEERQVSASELGSMSLPRTFVKDVPQSAKLLRSLTLHAVGSGSRSHSVRLEPSPAHANKFPPLDLDIVVTPDMLGQENLEIRSVKAVLAESSVDHLLPESVVDVRFTRKLTHELLTGPESFPSLETLHSELQGCFQRSMTSNNEIPLPVFTSITLPTHLLESKGQLSEATDQAAVEYMYLPVSDVQGTHVSQYDIRDTHLFYASYDSGPYKSSLTTDLYLKMESTDNSNADNVVFSTAPTPQSSEKQFNSFYGTACAVASHLDLLQ
ncbi:hypothetical protein BDV06DRAFT_194428 [Aspergillus oleicola]